MAEETASRSASSSPLQIVARTVELGGQGQCILNAPCVFCGYTGAGYWQSGTHDKKCPFHTVGGDATRCDHIVALAASEPMVPNGEYRDLHLGGSSATPSSITSAEPMLPALCEALGWQGGTIHQALAEVRRLRSTGVAPERTNPNGLWMVWYEDAAVKPEVFFGEGAEASARLRYKHARDNWSCHLMSRVPTKDADSDRAQDTMIEQSSAIEEPKS